MSVVYDMGGEVVRNPKPRKVVVLDGEPGELELANENGMTRNESSRGMCWGMVQSRAEFDRMVNAMVCLGVYDLKEVRWEDAERKEDGQ